MDLACLGNGGIIGVKGPRPQLAARRRDTVIRGRHRQHVAFTYAIFLEVQQLAEEPVCANAEVANLGRVRAKRMADEGCAIRRAEPQSIHIQRRVYMGPKSGGAKISRNARQTAPCNNESSAEKRAGRTAQRTCGEPYADSTSC